VKNEEGGEGYPLPAD